MPPKVKITKNDIINIAVTLVKQNGEQSLNARNIASTLGCSTQPIFSNFASMDDLRLAVVENAYVLYKEYITKEIQSGNYPAYKASGMAYIRFAKEEKELFKLLFMRDRTNEKSPEVLDIDNDIKNILHKNTGLKDAEIQMFHLEMWAYVHGIASMFATGFLNLEWELVSKMLSDCYLGIRKQYGLE